MTLGNVDNLVKRVKESKEIIPENKQKILEFHNYSLARGLSKSRLIKYLYMLPTISKLLGKPFRKANKNDMIKLFSEIEQKNYADWTKRTYKVIVKAYWRWLKGIEDKGVYPEEVKWIKTSIINNKQYNILTEEEVSKLIAAASNWRDKAFVLGLYESGCRIQEFLDMKIKDVTFDEYSPILNTNGKTGFRRIRIIDKQSFLKSWLQDHPFKEDPNSFVWVSLSTNATNTPLSYRHAVNLLRKLGKKSKINKPVNPHNFRHSRATHLATKLTEYQLKQLFGWTQASKMAATYVHLSGRDLDEPLLKMFNVLKEKGEEKKQELALDSAFKLLLQYFKMASKNPKYKGKISEVMKEFATQIGK